MIENQKTSSPEYTPELMRDALQAAIKPLEPETHQFGPISDDWRLANIQRLLPSAAMITYDGADDVKLERKTDSFHIREIGKLSGIKRPRETVSDSDDTSVWGPSVSHQSTLESLFSKETPLRVPLTSVQLIHDEAHQVLDLQSFLAHLDPKLSNFVFSQVFAKDKKINSKGDTTITFEFPIDSTSLFALFHEVGHLLDTTAYQEEFDGSILSVYEFSERGRIGENIQLAELVNRERQAWAFSYYAVKKLRQLGFIKFSDADFKMHMAACLETYETATKKIPGKFTPSTHFTQKERAEARKEYSSPNPSQRLTHVIRKVFRR